MSPKKWILAALMVAASLPALANSRASKLASQPLLVSSEIAGTGAGLATNFENRLLFRSTLNDESSGSSEILMANWMNSQHAEIKNQARAAILPEPGSGVLFCIGLLALLYWAGTRLPTPGY